MRSLRESAAKLDKQAMEKTGTQAVPEIHWVVSQRDSGFCTAVTLLRITGERV